MQSMLNVLLAKGGQIVAREPHAVFSLFKCGTLNSRCVRLPRSKTGLQIFFFGVLLLAFNRSLRRSVLPDLRKPSAKFCFKNRQR